MRTFIKGMDISTLIELEKLGVDYKDKEGNSRELLAVLKEYGVNAVRIRVWNDPYDENGVSYGAGTNDLKTAIQLAKRVKDAGMQILLNLHYSDFWADPGKQFVPKAWRGYCVEQLEEAVYHFTKEVLEAFKENNCFPDMFQVGNELSNGLLWPYGKVPNWDNIARFINAGIRASREVKKDLPLMVHLDNGGNNELYREWFDHFMEKGEDFEVIGLSYYPFWHGSLSALENNMNDIAKRYGKDLVVAEVSMGHTMEDYSEYEKLTPKQRKGMATKPSLVEKIEYPMTEQGQADFMEDFLNRISNVSDQKGCGFYYWEPGWIPVAGSGWATEASLSYIEDKGPCGNEWANQALFDYKGNPLAALDIIKDFQMK